MFQNTKLRIIVAAVAVSLLAISIILVLNKKNTDKYALNIVGTWHSERPDTIIFKDDGTYTGDNKWLNSGTYKIDGDVILLNDILGGEVKLNIIRDKASNVVIKANVYTYYITKKEQQKSIEKNDEKISEVKENEISNDKKETNNVSTQSAAEKPKETKKVLKSVKNPDVSSYTQELARVVDTALIGTWKGHFDEWESSSTDYWIYTFNSDGTYSFTHGNSKESGTYKTTHDPNNNNYHSSLILTCGKETKKILFYLSGEKLNNLVTDDKTDPTYVKQ